MSSRIKFSQEVFPASVLFLTVATFTLLAIWAYLNQPIRTAEDYIREIPVSELPPMKRIFGDEELPDESVGTVFLVHWPVSDEQSLPIIRRWMEEHAAEFEENSSRFVFLASSPIITYESFGFEEEPGRGPSGWGYQVEIPLESSVEDVLREKKLPFRTAWRKI